MFDTVILADDLSGAADCAVTCVHWGLNTLVTLGAPAAGAIADVISIDADTRGLDAATAAIRMRSLTTAFAPDGATLLFKKIDSSLRGHLGTELAAVLQARRAAGAGKTVAVMAPALPASGRTVRRGCGHLNGTPLHESELWRDQNMAGEAYIPRMLQEARLTSKCFDLALVRGVRLEEAMREAASRFDVLVCDSVADEDLELIALAARRLKNDVVWVGSAGLARYWPCAPPASGADAVSSLLLAPTARPVLFVVGSICQTARKQVAMLASGGAVRAVTVSPEMLVNGRDSAEWRSISVELREALRQGQDVVLTPASSLVLEVEDRLKLSSSLAAMTADLRPEVGALVACGGETARMVLGCWQVSGLRLLGELERGVVISKAMNTDIDLTVVTKAGDFGTPETLAQCQRWLHDGKEVLR